MKTLPHLTLSIKITINITCYRDENSTTTDTKSKNHYQHHILEKKTLSPYHLHKLCV